MSNINEVKPPRKGKNYKSTTTAGIVLVDISGVSESQYLIYSNRQKCKELFSKTEWKHGELIDGYIALHIVMEAGLNSLFRKLALRSLKKDVDQIKVMKNIDEISFRHKAVLFIYNSKFDFDGKLSDAARYHKIIDTLKDFCAIRNELLHGHAIATIFGPDGSEPRHTTTRKNIMSAEEVEKQLDRFRFIMDGMIFYLDCLEDLSTQEKEQYKNDYLGYEFFPVHSA